MVHAHSIGVKNAKRFQLTDLISWQSVAFKKTLMASSYE
jgi:hypothetical protein